MFHLSVNVCDLFQHSATFCDIVLAQNPFMDFLEMAQDYKQKMTRNMLHIIFETINVASHFPKCQQGYSVAFRHF